MLNEERIRLMTHMAIYEENEGKKNVSIGSYFRGDYIGLQVIKSVLCATLAFFIMIAILLFYDFELVLQDAYKVDLLGVAKQVLAVYVVFVGIYGIISYMVFSYRYNVAKKSLREFHNNLKDLSALYEQEGRK